MNKIQLAAVVLIVLSIVFVGAAIYINNPASGMVEAGKTGYSAGENNLGGQVGLIAEPGVEGSS